MNVSNRPVPPELERQVRDALQSGERVQWMDMPLPGRLARSGWPSVLFGIPWTAFAVFWTGMAFYGTSKAKDAGWFRLFPLWGLPFILVGLGMLTSPLRLWLKARKTVYVIADRRALIFQRGWRGGMDVRSFEAESLTDLSRKQFADGSGDLIFARDWSTNTRRGTTAQAVGFVGVRDVQRVEELLRSLAAAARSKAGNHGA